MRVLITGALGFTARYLRNLLENNDHSEVYLSDIYPDTAQGIEACDLTRFDEVGSLIARVRPDRIYHLAGRFSNDYLADYSANVLTTKNIFDSLLGLRSLARVLLVGSASEYGLIKPGDNPVSEEHELRPVRVQGLTKVFQTHLMDFYHRVYGMDIVMARTFNLFGDGSLVSKSLFIGAIEAQIERFKKKEIAAIIVGNLESKRDYIDAGEAVRYYQKIMERGRSGQVYNVGSGECVKMRDLLSRILAEAGLDMSVVQEKVNAVSRDSTDIPEIYADIRKIKSL